MFDIPIPQQIQRQEIQIDRKNGRQFLKLVVRAMHTQGSEGSFDFTGTGLSINQLEQIKAAIEAKGWKCEWASGTCLIILKWSKP